MHSQPLIQSISPGPRSGSSNSISIHMKPSSFEKMGAGIRVERIEKPLLGDPRVAGSVSSIRGNFDAIPGLSVDVQGSTFAVTAPHEVDLIVLQADAKDKHLLLMARDDETGINHKFLCGMDERDWFVASVDSKSVSIQDAKNRLMPRAAMQSVVSHNVKRKKRHNRHNKGYIRQGEWFFMPINGLFDIDERAVLHHEPISRGGKPHMVEQLYRTGGEAVHVHPRFAPNGLVNASFKKLSGKRQRDPLWRVMRRNPNVYAKGRVRHPDHKTITLHDWRLVQLNVEVRTASLAFLD